MRSSKVVGRSTGQIGRIRAPDDLVHQTSGLTAELLVDRGIRGQSPALDVKHPLEHRRETTY